MQYKEFSHGILRLSCQTYSTSKKEMLHTNHSSFLPQVRGGLFQSRILGCACPKLTGSSQKKQSFNIALSVFNSSKYL